MIGLFFLNCHSCRLIGQKSVTRDGPSLTPHPSPLTPHPSLLTPHSSPLLALLGKLLKTFEIEDFDRFTVHLDQVVIGEFAQGA